MFSYWGVLSGIMLCLAAVQSYLGADWRYPMCCALLFSTWAIITRLDELKTRALPETPTEEE